jgi:zinc transporter, ZIP family
VFLGNVPESLSSAASMKQQGRSRGYIVAAWGTVAVLCTFATIAGYALLGGLSASCVSANLALVATPRPVLLTAVDTARTCSGCTLLE